MCIGFLQLTRDDEHLGNRPPERPARGKAAVELLRQRASASQPAKGSP
jgi:hypothetical protein